jgi:hypothetical protein
MTTVAITTSSGGAALAAIETAAIFSAVAFVVTLGLRPLAVKALDYVDGLPPAAVLETADDEAANAVSDPAVGGRRCRSAPTPRPARGAAEKDQRSSTRGA